MDSDMVFCYNSCHNVEGVDKTARMSEKTKPPTILYVEDDLNNRILIRRILVAEGYEVVKPRTDQKASSWPGPPSRILS